MDKAQFLKHLRELVGEGNIGEALDWLSKNASEYTNKFGNDILMLKSRFSLAKNQFVIGSIIEFREYGQIISGVSFAILELADKIEKEVTNPKFYRKGQILHKIPSKMTVNIEVKCIIRVAYEIIALIKKIKVDSETEVQEIQVAEIMSVELLDNNKSNIFNIRTCTDEEQFLIHDDFTQWIFFVQPLVQGRYPLLMKIAVVEQINGKERKRNIVFEKEINIESKEIAPKETIFTNTNIKIISITEKKRNSGEKRQRDILEKIKKIGEELSLDRSSLVFNPATGSFEVIDMDHQIIANKDYPSIETDPDMIKIDEIRPVGWACFLKGTKIMLGDLTEKNIEDLTSGEEVLTKDRETGELNIKLIKNIIVSRDVEYLVINNLLKITIKEHIVTKRGTIAASDLKISDYLEFFEGNFVQIFSMRWVKKNVKVFNLRFEDPSLFYANKFLVGDLILKNNRLNSSNSSLLPTAR